MDVAWARIESVPGVALSLLDLRADGCTVMGAPTDTVRAQDHAAGRAFGRAIQHDHDDIDGFLYEIGGHPVTDDLFDFSTLILLRAMLLPPVRTGGSVVEDRTRPRPRAASNWLFPPDGWPFIPGRLALLNRCQWLFCTGFCTLRLFVFLAARRPRFGFGDIDIPLSGVSVGTIVIPARAPQNARINERGRRRLGIAPWGTPMSERRVYDLPWPLVADRP